MPENYKIKDCYHRCHSRDIDDSRDLCGQCQIEKNAKKNDDMFRREADNIITRAVKLKPALSKLVLEYRSYFTEELQSINQHDVILKFDPIVRKTILGAVNSMNNENLYDNYDGIIEGFEESYIYFMFGGKIPDRPARVAHRYAIADSKQWRQRTTT